MDIQVIKTNCRNWIEKMGKQHSGKIAIAKEVLLVILDELFPKIIGIDWFEELWEYREIVVMNTTGETTVYFTFISNMLIIQIFSFFKQRINQSTIIIRVIKTFINIHSTIKLQEIKIWMDKSKSDLKGLMNQIQKPQAENFGLIQRYSLIGKMTDFDSVDVGSNPTISTNY